MRTSSRSRPRIPRGLGVLAAALVLASVGWPASPALAATLATPCDEFLQSTDDEEFIDYAQYAVAPSGFDLPAPLDAISPICTFALPYGPGDADESSDAWFLDVAANDFVQVFRSFEAAGWTQSVPSNEYAARVTADFDADAFLADDPKPNIILAFRSADDSIELYLNYEAAVPTTGDDVAAIEVWYWERGARGTGIADPSVLSNLRTVQDSIPNQTQTGVIVGASLFLTLVIGYPGFLLSAVISSRYEQLFGWSRRGRVGAAVKRISAFQPRWLVWVGVTVAAVIAGFVDPKFGWNPMSARLLLTALAAYAVYNVLGWMLVGRVLTRIAPDLEPIARLRWGSLVIVALSVLLSRLLDFNPGVIFGLVAGLAFAASLALAREALVVLIGAAFAAAAGLAAWVGYSLLALLPGVVGGNVVIVTAREALSVITIEGIATLPLALIPLAVLDGGILLAWKKWVWAVSYAIASVLFMLVLVTVPDSWGTVSGDFARWVAIFVGFGLVAAGVWGLDRTVRRRAEREYTPKLANRANIT